MRSLLIVVLSLYQLVVGSICYSESAPIRLGGAFALTGSGARWGESEREGAELAIAELLRGGLAIELKVEDTASTTIGTISAVQKLISIDRIQAIIGPTWLDQYPATIPIAEREGIPLVSTSAIMEAVDPGRNQTVTFGLHPSIDREVSVLLTGMKAKGISKVSLFFEQGPYFELVRQKILDQLNLFSLDLVSSIEVQMGEQDFRSLLQRKIGESAQAIIFGFTDGGSLLSFIQQFKQFRSSLSLWTFEYLEEYAQDDRFGELLTGVHYVRPQISQEFSDKFADHYGEKPFFGASQSYDAVMGLVQAFQATEKHPGGLLAELRTRRWDTVSYGSIHLGKWRQVEGGRFRLVRVGDNSSTDTIDGANHQKIHSDRD